jgi:signal transduction histidine kinase
MNWFCREFEKTHPHIRVEKQIELSESGVTDSLKTAIYSISQEALNNIAKHSKADRVDLFLRKTNAAIELGIKDNGQGFEVKELFATESYKSGLGLSSMRERAEVSGGYFNIESIKGKGTTIRASWPIE